MATQIQNEFLQVSAGNEQEFIELLYKRDGSSYKLQAPIFEINEQKVNGPLRFQSSRPYRKLRNGGEEVEMIFLFQHLEYIRLNVYVQIFPNSPFIRYRYRLTAETAIVLTKKDGADRLTYTGFRSSCSAPVITEVQFSQFDPINHSYVPHFQQRDADELVEEAVYAGPITLLEDVNSCCVIAYEHGAEYVDNYLMFRASSDEGRIQVSIAAAKGNYYQGQVVDRDHPFDSIWFHFAHCGDGIDALLQHYRTFNLRYITENAESRKPYIFYNTWNNQERNRHFKGAGYWDRINLGQMLQEIDAAYAIGVDVFVIDTGWFTKSGDWQVDLQRFPDGLKKVKERLDLYGMKLGLWMNPMVAAKTSGIYTSHPEYVITFNGVPAHFGEIWGTEESFGMCLVSDYSDLMIETMTRLHRELGVTYFKWDGISQYGCNSPVHHHGTLDSDPQERSECYSYRIGLEMIRIVEELNRVVPDIIVDFDVTERGRFVGLGFLSVGKYFLVNNGPYAMDFDIPESVRLASSHDPIDVDGYTQLFFYPGTARSQICRAGTLYDSFAPSILFLTHFLPDLPEVSQSAALASLMLGGNGVWGDLLSLTEADKIMFRETLFKYKKVAESVTASYPRVRGFIGSSPEIHEKILYEDGKGMICFFTKAKGSFEHITRKIDKQLLVMVDGADFYEWTDESRLKIRVSLEENESRFVFLL